MDIVIQIKTYTIIRDKACTRNDTYSLFLEGENFDYISEITEDDFYKTFDEYVKLCREKLNDIINYKSLGDQFTFKNSIINTTFELKDKNSLSNKVLAVLKTKEE